MLAAKNQNIHLCRKIIISQFLENVKNVDGKICILGNVENDNKIVNDAYFQEIEAKVLNAIDKAVVSIWVAMAWFTNERIYNKLKEKINA